MQLISGCGVFVHHQQTYYVNSITSEEAGQAEPQLSAQIVPSVDDFHILFLYMSRKWTSPYTVHLSSRSDKPVDSYFLIHSFKVKSGDQLVAEKIFTRPLKLKLTKKTRGSYVYYDCEYRYELDDRLQFEEGKEVELEVIYEQPGVSEKRTLRLKGTGEEKKNKSSLWNAYMSV